MAKLTTIALDAMGGDIGPDVVVPAALDVLAQEPQLSIVLVGDQPLLENQYGDQISRFKDRCRCHHASQVVSMDEKASSALRLKKDSSMRVALNLVKKQEADACVSAGNTGALLSTARFVLKTLPGIDRPAIISSIPAMNGYTHMLDLGANIDSTSEHLLQFAVMGTELVKAVNGIASPRVGLLNIGEEEMKGNERVKNAANLIAASPLNYIGFVEGDDIYKGGVDVVVSDGFVGNISLKTSEGVAKLITHFLKEAFSKNVFTKLAAFIVMPVLKSFKAKIDPRVYNGASLLGLRGIVIKSHGGADKFAFANAIKIAVLEVEKAVPSHIAESVAEILIKEE
jgi:phosphate acyltransferase